MLAAGTGVAWAARRLGLSAEAAIAAGLLYQLSPYLVPYISRTSSMLLPWAGLGWIIGLTIGAATRTRWRDAALCALVVGTVGAVNTTAMLMIAPAPVLWLVVAVAERTVTLRSALAAALRIGGLALGDVGVVAGDAGRSRAARAPTCSPTRSRSRTSASRPRRSRCGDRSATG